MTLILYTLIVCCEGEKVIYERNFFFDHCRPGIEVGLESFPIACNRNRHAAVVIGMIIGVERIG
jgi:hypothetical protein